VPIYAGYHESCPDKKLLSPIYWFLRDLANFFSIEDISSCVIDSDHSLCILSSRRIMTRPLSENVNKIAFLSTSAKIYKLEFCSQKAIKNRKYVIKNSNFFKRDL
jgi:hypothetical protein